MMGPAQAFMNDSIRKNTIMPIHSSKCQKNISLQKYPGKRQRQWQTWLQCVAPCTGRWMCALFTWLIYMPPRVCDPR